MVIEVRDVESFKQFIRQRAQESWEERRTPYYLSFVATDLKRLGVDYRELVAPLRLSQWATANEVPDTLLVSHPTQRARIGFVPASSGFSFDDADQQSSEGKAGSERRSGHGRTLVQFVQSLSHLPDTAVEGFSIPAKTLIALLKH
jgi:hypothetical protein